MTIAVALGSNLGESKKILTEAIQQLQKIHIRTPASFFVSSFYETDPVDCPLQSPRFLNAVVQLETELTPHELLELFQKMEEKAGRSFSHPRNAPRTLDLDLLYCDAMIISTPELELPHPKITQRSFVLMPLAEITPDLILPGWEKTARDYLLNITK